ncbi:hypothetical protein HORIV_22930 [Vreelandella olivaria]|uniref:Uncharacterized protein n=1 Tax=Vreelandella olivaria TaxID=390919 RepID=A0ABM9SCY3_9GAMM|nr:hypothetical protein HORIV_22930 [Halomonas olivaria]
MIQRDIKDKNLEETKAKILDNSDDFVISRSMSLVIIKARQFQLMQQELTTEMIKEGKKLNKKLKLIKRLKWQSEYNKALQSTVKLSFKLLRNYVPVFPAPERGVKHPIRIWEFMNSSKHPLQPDATIHKILISTTSRMVGEFISDDILISHAWQNFTNSSGAIRMEENPVSRSGFIIAFQTEPYRKEAGIAIPDYSPVGEIVCSYLSVLFGKRFDCHGLVEGSGFSIPLICPHIAAYVIQSYRLTHINNEAASKYH